VSAVHQSASKHGKNFSFFLSVSQQLGCTQPVSGQMVPGASAPAVMAAACWCFDSWCQCLFWGKTMPSYFLACVSVEKFKDFSEAVSKSCATAQYYFICLPKNNLFLDFLLYTPIL